MKPEPKPKPMKPKKFGYETQNPIFLGMIPKQKPKGLVSYPIFWGFGYGFGFHTQNFWVLGVGMKPKPKT